MDTVTKDKVGTAGGEKLDFRLISETVKKFEVAEAAAVPDMILINWDYVHMIEYMIGDEVRFNGSGSQFSGTISGIPFLFYNTEADISEAVSEYCKSHGRIPLVIVLS